MYEQDFQTGPRSWGTAHLIENSEEDAWSPDIAYGPNGEAIAVWVQEVEGISRLWASIYNPTSGWGTESIIYSGPNHAHFPDITYDSQGNATVVWMQQNVDGTDWVTWAIRYSNGVWLTAEPIEDIAGKSGSYPFVSTDNNGNAMAVWWAETGSYGIWSNRYTAGVGWGTPERVRTTSTYAARVKLAMNSEGNAVAVWEESNQVWANIYTAGEGWGTPQTIENLGGIAHRPWVALDSDGIAVVVWGEYTNSSRTEIHIWSNKYEPNIGWGTPQALTQVTGSGAKPFIRFDNQGNAYLLEYWI